MARVLGRRRAELGKELAKAKEAVGNQQWESAERAFQKCREIVIDDAEPVYASEVIRHHLLFLKQREQPAEALALLEEMHKHFSSLTRGIVCGTLLAWRACFQPQEQALWSLHEALTHWQELLGTKHEIVGTAHGLMAAAFPPENPKAAVHQKWFSHIEQLHAALGSRLDSVGSLEQLLESDSLPRRHLPRGWDYQIEPPGMEFDLVQAEVNAAQAETLARWGLKVLRLTLDSGEEVRPLNLEGLIAKQLTLRGRRFLSGVEQIRGVHKLSLVPTLPPRIAPQWTEVEEIEVLGYDCALPGVAAWPLRRLRFASPPRDSVPELSELDSLQELVADQPLKQPLSRFSAQCELRRLVLQGGLRELPELNPLALEELVVREGLEHPPNWLMGCRRLKTLRLGGGAARELEHLQAPELESLQLDFVGAERLGFPQWILSQTRLKHLHLSGFWFSALPEGFDALVNLERLTLESNRLETLEGLSRLPRLKHLSAVSNRLESVDLSGCQALESLTLSQNFLGSWPLRSAPYLKSLRLDNNELLEIPPVDFPRLEQLNLNQNFFRAGIENLLGLPSLKSLEMVTLDLSASDRNLLRDAFTQCRLTLPTCDLLSDPQEKDPAKARWIRLASKRAAAEVEVGFGQCHAHWALQRKILAEEYGIDWKSPAQMNPNVCFD